MPPVEQIERLLMRIGYLAGVPDWTYTDATAEAVARFQALAGLPTTGAMDAATYRQLVVRSTVVGGC